MRRLLTCIALSALVLPLASRADGSIQLSVSAGVAKPYGDVGEGLKLSDSIDWAFPLEGRLAFRVVKQLAVGAYARFAPTTASSTCPGCTINDLGLGGLVEYRFSEKLEGGPWLGLSGGWEQLKTTATGTPAATATGFEGAVSGGADFELGGLTFGPFAQASFGEFTKTSVGGQSRSIESKGVHGMFSVGVRLILLM
jgi:hypothetical protein